MDQGRIFRDLRLPGLSAAERTALYVAAVELLAKLHSLHLTSLDLDRYGRGSGYCKRQVNNTFGFFFIFVCLFFMCRTKKISVSCFSVLYRCPPGPDNTLLQPIGTFQPWTNSLIGCWGIYQPTTMRSHSSTAISAWITWYSIQLRCSFSDCDCLNFVVKVKLFSSFCSLLKGSGDGTAGLGAVHHWAAAGRLGLLPDATLLAQRPPGCQYTGQLEGSRRWRDLRLKHLEKWFLHLLTLWSLCVCLIYEQEFPVWRIWSPSTGSVGESHLLSLSWISTWPCLSLRWQVSLRWVKVSSPALLQ